MYKMYTPILAANSNGTYVNDLFDALPQHFQGMKKGVARLTKAEEVVMNTNDYHPFMINGFGYLVSKLRQTGSKMAVVSNASEGLIRKVNGQLGLDDIVRNFGLFDPATKEKREKDDAILEEVRTAMMEDGQIPVAYISHKLDEAELGASAYGIGIMIDPNAKAPYTYEFGDGKVIVVDRLDSDFAISTIEFLLDADTRIEEQDAGETAVEAPAEASSCSE